MPSSTALNAAGAGPGVRFVDGREASRSSMINGIARGKGNTVLEKNLILRRGTEGRF